MEAIRRAFARLAVLGVTCGLGLGLVPSPAVLVRTAAAADNTPWTLPTRPARCTTAQANAGTVAGCLLGGYDAPDANGWPNPPFPSDPTTTGNELGVLPLPGWTWSGYGYNGSPALTAWEAMLVANQSAIGRVHANQLRAMPEALPLFEGFLRDIVAGGYSLTDAYTYSFRCTSGSGKSCAGKSRDSLSNHSWGLAMDMNSGANPETTYIGINGASACATPITTDIPQWVVQTAEKWGLYWGGYGWSTGCTSPAEMRATASRDATHFEFRGTPSQAQAIAAKNLGGSCLPTVNDAGTFGSTCLAPGDVPAAGVRVVIDTTAPKGATAALVNIAMTGATADGYVTADTCAAAAPGPRTTSNGNTMAGQTVANLSVVPLDSSGRFCLFRSKPMHTIVDVQGYFAPAGTAGPTGTTFNAVAPARLLDTRTTPACDPSGACLPAGAVPGGVEIAVNAPVVPPTATAVLANLAITEPSAAGYLTADSCPTLAPGPQTHANANYATGATLSNLAVVPVSAAAGTGATQFCTVSMSTAHEVVDLQGYFAVPTAAAPGAGFTAVPTQRVVDTRGCWTDPITAIQRCALVNDAGSIIRMSAPAGASAVLVNITLTEAAGDGFATAQPCSLLQGAVPGVANGNVAAGRTAGNLAVVGVDPDGTFCVRVSAPMHVVVDLQGTFAANGTARFIPTAPVRRSDTRAPGGI